MPPTSTAVSIADVRGSGTTVSPLTLQYQGAFVSLAGMYAQVAPVPGAAGNYSVMQVSANSTDTTNTIGVVVSGFPSAGCAQSNLQSGLPRLIGEVRGVLMYYYGQWVVQLRAASDIASLRTAGLCP
jgi:hypothetical protein